MDVGKKFLKIFGNKSFFCQNFPKTWVEKIKITRLTVNGLDQIWVLSINLGLLITRIKPKK